MGQTTIGGDYYNYFFGQSVDISDDGSLVAVSAVASSRHGSGGLTKLYSLAGYEAKILTPLTIIEDNFMGMGTATVSISGNGN